jgi:hypothetical protein
MTYKEAEWQLQLHAGVFGTQDILTEAGDEFLPSLRRYSGMHEKNIHIVMEALLVVGARIATEPQIDRDIIKAVWLMCWYARDWGVSPTGSLRRNQLISDADSSRLATWVDMIERTMLGLLRGQPPHEVVSYYATYITQAGWWENIHSFILLMKQAVSDPDVVVSSLILRALGKLGHLARLVLPSLREAMLRYQSFEVPATVVGIQEIEQKEIKNAIDAIEQSVREHEG